MALGAITAGWHSRGDGSKASRVAWFIEAANKRGLISGLLRG
jgi:hypothetical protein